MDEKVAEVIDCFNELTDELLPLGIECKLPKLAY